MNYYKEIKEELINKEINKKVNNYLVNRSELIFIIMQVRC